MNPEETKAADLPPALLGPYLRIVEALLDQGGGASDFRGAARALLGEVSEATGCEAVGLRVHDRKDDYPYFVYCGFDGSFIERESRLCEVDDSGRFVRCEGGQALLECMCGAVLRGLASPEELFFTEYGSFWTNSTTGLLVKPSDTLKALRTRNTCNREGYESVALVPMRTRDEIVGLIQANSRERGRFTPDVLDFLERIGRHAAAAVETAWRREELERLSSEFEERRRGVETAVALGEMAAELAHELKNPLAGMMLSATRLRKALVNIEGQDKLVSISDHLISSTNALSETVSRIGGATRQPKLDRQDVAVNEVLESAAALVAPRTAEQDVAVVRNMQDDLPPVSADAHFLTRAFLNLMVNALDVMPSGGILYLGSTASDDGTVRVTIGDTGPGVAPEEAELFFRPFQTAKSGGTGLGLGIVRRIVELHSGSVVLGPREGGGAEAVVTLPLAEGRPGISRDHIGPDLTPGGRTDRESK
jgi:signal transduction histidine kinase